MNQPASATLITKLKLNGLARRLINEGLISQSDALIASEEAKKQRISLVTHLVKERKVDYHTSLRTEPVLVEEDKLAQLLETALAENDAMAMMKGLTDADLENLIITAEGDTKAPDVGAPDVDDTPVVRFINKVLLDAINKKASDIHFEPYEKMYRVRFRVDGILEEITSPPVTLAPRLAARLKVMSRLDISERR